MSAALGAEKPGARTGLNNSFVQKLLRRPELFSFFGLAFLALCNVVFLTGVWMWKKWGVYGYCTLALLVMLVALKVSPVSALGSLAWGAAIAATIGPRWRYFE